MPTLEVTLSENQYQQLACAAQDLQTSVEELVLQAVEAFVRSQYREARYARLTRKSAAWRALQVQAPVSHPDGATLRESDATYQVKPDPHLKEQLDDLRLDLIYHSEALENSPLTRAQVKDAIQE